MENRLKYLVSFEADQQSVNDVERAAKSMEGVKGDVDSKGVENLTQALGAAAKQAAKVNAELDKAEANSGKSGHKKLSEDALAATRAYRELGAQITATQKAVKDNPAAAPRVDMAAVQRDFAALDAALAKHTDLFGKRLSAALGKALKFEMPELKLDTSRITAQVTDATKKAVKEASKAKVTIGVDTSGVEKGLRDAASKAARTPATVKVQVDTSQADREIANLNRRAKLSQSSSPATTAFLARRAQQAEAAAAQDRRQTQRLDRMQALAQGSSYMGVSSEKDRKNGAGAYALKSRIKNAREFDQTPSSALAPTPVRLGKAPKRVQARGPEAVTDWEQRRYEQLMDRRERRDMQLQARRQVQVDAGYRVATFRAAAPVRGLTPVDQAATRAARPRSTQVGDQSQVIAMYRAVTENGRLSRQELERELKFIRRETSQGKPVAEDPREIRAAVAFQRNIMPLVKQREDAKARYRAIGQAYGEFSTSTPEQKVQIARTRLGDPKATAQDMERAFYDLRESAVQTARSMSNELARVYHEESKNYRRNVTESRPLAPGVDPWAGFTESSAARNSRVNADAYRTQERDRARRTNRTPARAPSTAPIGSSLYIDPNAAPVRTQARRTVKRAIAAGVPLDKMADGGLRFQENHKPATLLYHEPKRLKSQMEFFSNPEKYLKAEQERARKGEAFKPEALLEAFGVVRRYGDGDDQRYSLEPGSDLFKQVEALGKRGAKGFADAKVAENGTLSATFQQMADGLGSMRDATPATSLRRLTRAMDPYQLVRSISRDVSHKLRDEATSRNDHGLMDALDAQNRNREFDMNAEQRGDESGDVQARKLAEVSYAGEKFDRERLRALAQGPGTGSPVLAGDAYANRFAYEKEHAQGQLAHLIGLREKALALKKTMGEGDSGVGGSLSAGERRLIDWDPTNGVTDAVRPEMLADFRREFEEAQLIAPGSFDVKTRQPARKWQAIAEMPEPVLPDRPRVSEMQERIYGGMQKTFDALFPSEGPAADLDQELVRHRARMAEKIVRVHDREVSLDDEGVDRAKDDAPQQTLRELSPAEFMGTMHQVASRAVMIGQAAGFGSGTEASRNGKVLGQKTEIQAGVNMEIRELTRSDRTPDKELVEESRRALARSEVRSRGEAPDDLGNEAESDTERAQEGLTPENVLGKGGFDEPNRDGSDLPFVTYDRDAQKKYEAGLGKEKPELSPLERRAGMSDVQRAQAEDQRNADRIKQAEIRAELARLTPAELAARDLRLGHAETPTFESVKAEVDATWKARKAAGTRVVHQSDKGSVPGHYTQNWKGQLGLSDEFRAGRGERESARLADWKMMLRADQSDAEVRATALGDARAALAYARKFGPLTPADEAAIYEDALREIYESDDVLAGEQTRARADQLQAEKGGKDSTQGSLIGTTIRPPSFGKVGQDDFVVPRVAQADPVVSDKVAQVSSWTDADRAKAAGVLTPEVTPAPAAKPKPPRNQLFWAEVMRQNALRPAPVPARDPEPEPELPREVVTPGRAEGYDSPEHRQRRLDRLARLHSLRQVSVAAEAAKVAQAVPKRAPLNTASGLSLGGTRLESLGELVSRSLNVELDQRNVDMQTRQISAVVAKAAEVMRDNPLPTPPTPVTPVGDALSSAAGAPNPALVEQGQRELREQAEQASRDAEKKAQADTEAWAKKNAELSAQAKKATQEIPRRPWHEALKRKYQLRETNQLDPEQVARATAEARLWRESAAYAPELPPRKEPPRKLWHSPKAVRELRNDPNAPKRAVWQSPASQRVLYGGYSSPEAQMQGLAAEAKARAQAGLEQMGQRLSSLTDWEKKTNQFTYEPPVPPKGPTGPVTPTGPTQPPRRKRWVSPTEQRRLDAEAKRQPLGQYVKQLTLASNLAPLLGLKAGEDPEVGFEYDRDAKFKDEQAKAQFFSLAANLKAMAGPTATIKPRTTPGKAPATPAVPTVPVPGTPAAAPTAPAGGGKAPPSKGVPVPKGHDVDDEDDGKTPRLIEPDEQSVSPALINDKGFGKVMNEYRAGTLTSSDVADIINQSRQDELANPENDFAADLRNKGELTAEDIKQRGFAANGTNELSARAWSDLSTIGRAKADMNGLDRVSGLLGESPERIKTGVGGATSLEAAMKEISGRGIGSIGLQSDEFIKTIGDFGNQLLAAPQDGLRIITEARARLAELSARERSKVADLEGRETDRGLDAKLRGSEMSNREKAAQNQGRLANDRFEAQRKLENRLMMNAGSLTQAGPNGGISLLGAMQQATKKDAAALNNVGSEALEKLVTLGEQFQAGEISASELSVNASDVLTADPGNAAGGTMSGAQQRAFDREVGDLTSSDRYRTMQAAEQARLTAQYTAGLTDPAQIRQAESQARAESRALATNTAGEQVLQRRQNMGAVNAGLTNMAAFIGGSAIESGFQAAVEQLKQLQLGQQVLDRAIQSSGVMGGGETRTLFGITTGDAGAPAKKLTNNMAGEFGASVDQMAQLYVTLNQGGEKSYNETKLALEQLSDAAARTGATIDEIGTALTSLDAAGIQDPAKFMQQYAGLKDLDMGKIAATADVMGQSQYFRLTEQDDREQMLVSGAQQDFGGFSQDIYVAAEQAAALKKTLDSTKMPNSNSFVKSMERLVGVNATMARLRELLGNIVGLLSPLVALLLIATNAALALVNGAVGVADAIPYLKELIGTVLALSAAYVAAGAASAFLTGGTLTAGGALLGPGAAAAANLGKLKDAYVRANAAMTVANMSSMLSFTRLRAAIMAIGAPALWGRIVAGVVATSTAIKVALGPIGWILAALGIAATVIGAVVSKNKAKDAKKAEDDQRTAAVETLISGANGSILSNTNIGSMDDVTPGSKASAELARVFSGDAPELLALMGLTIEEVNKQLEDLATKGTDGQKRFAASVRDSMVQLQGFKNITAATLKDNELVEQRAVAAAKAKDGSGIMSRWFGMKPDERRFDVDYELAGKKAARSTIEKNLDKQLAGAQEKADARYAAGTDSARTIYSRDTMQENAPEVYQEYQDALEASDSQILALEQKRLTVRHQMADSQARAADSSLLEAQAQQTANDAELKGLRAILASEQSKARIEGVASDTSAIEMNINDLVEKRVALEERMRTLRIDQIQALQQQKDLLDAMNNQGVDPLSGLNMGANPLDLLTGKTSVGDLTNSATGIQQLADAVIKAAADPNLTPEQRSKIQPYAVSFEKAYPQILELQKYYSQTTRRREEIEKDDDLSAAQKQVKLTALEAEFTPQINGLIKNVDTAMNGAMAQVLQTVTKVIPQMGTINPFKDAKITQAFGKASGWSGYEYHDGTDFALAQGAPVRAPSSGRLSIKDADPKGLLNRSLFPTWMSPEKIYAGNQAAMSGLNANITTADGRVITTMHGDRAMTWASLTAQYGKEAVAQLKAGKSIDVKTGQVIMAAGNTGNSTGTHVHYEEKIGGKAVDPLGDRGLLGKPQGSSVVTSTGQVMSSVYGKNAFDWSAMNPGKEVLGDSMDDASERALEARLNLLPGDMQSDETLDARAQRYATSAYDQQLQVLAAQARERVKIAKTNFARAEERYKLELTNPNLTPDQKAQLDKGYMRDKIAMEREIKAAASDLTVGRDTALPDGVIAGIEKSTRSKDGKDGTVEQLTSRISLIRKAITAAGTVDASGTSLKQRDRTSYDKLTDQLYAWNVDLTKAKKSRGDNFKALDRNLNTMWRAATGFATAGENAARTFLERVVDDEIISAQQKAKLGVKDGKAIKDSTLARLIRLTDMQNQSRAGAENFQSDLGTEKLQNTFTPWKIDTQGNADRAAAELARQGKLFDRDIAPSLNKKDVAAERANFLDPWLKLATQTRQDVKAREDADEKFIESSKQIREQIGLSAQTGPMTRSAEQMVKQADDQYGEGSAQAKNAREMLAAAQERDAADLELKRNQAVSSTTGLTSAGAAFEMDKRSVAEYGKKLQDLGMDAGEIDQIMRGLTNTLTQQGQAFLNLARTAKLAWKEQADTTAGRARALNVPQSVVDNRVGETAALLDREQTSLKDLQRPLDPLRLKMEREAFLKDNSAADMFGQAKEELQKVLTPAEYAAAQRQVANPQLPGNSAAVLGTIFDRIVLPKKQDEVTVGTKELTGETTRGILGKVQEFNTGFTSGFFEKYLSADSMENPEDTLRRDLNALTTVRAIAAGRANEGVPVSERRDIMIKSATSEDVMRSLLVSGKLPELRDVRKELETNRARASGVTGTDTASVALRGQLQVEEQGLLGRVSGLLSSLSAFMPQEMLVALERELRSSGQQTAETAMTLADLPFRVAAEKSARAKEQLDRGFERAQQSGPTLEAQRAYYAQSTKSAQVGVDDTLDNAEAVLKAGLIASGNAAGGNFKDASEKELALALTSKDDGTKLAALQLKAFRDARKSGVNILDALPEALRETYRGFETLLDSLPFEEASAAMTLAGELTSRAAQMRDSTRLITAKDTFDSALTSGQFGRAGAASAAVLRDPVDLVLAAVNARDKTNLTARDYARVAADKKNLADPRVSGLIMDVNTQRRDMQKAARAQAFGDAMARSDEDFARGTQQARPRFSQEAGREYDERAARSKVSAYTEMLANPEFAGLEGEITGRLRTAQAELREASANMQDAWKENIRTLFGSIVGSVQDAFKKIALSTVDRLLGIQSEAAEAFQAGKRKSLNDESVINSQLANLDAGIAEAKDNSKTAGSQEDRDYWLGVAKTRQEARDKLALEGVGVRGTREFDAGEEDRRAAKENGAVWRELFGSIKTTLIDTALTQAFDQGIGKLSEKMLNNALGIEEPSVKLDSSAFTASMTEFTAAAQVVTDAGLAAQGAAQMQLDAATTFVGGVTTLVAGANQLAAVAAGASAAGIGTVLVDTVTAAAPLIEGPPAPVVTAPAPAPAPAPVPAPGVVKGQAVSAPAPEKLSTLQQAGQLAVMAAASAVQVPSTGVRGVDYGIGIGKNAVAAGLVNMIGQAGKQGLAAAFKDGALGSLGNPWMMAAQAATFVISDVMNYMDGIQQWQDAHQYQGKYEKTSAWGNQKGKYVEIDGKGGKQGVTVQNVNVTQPLTSPAAQREIGRQVNAQSATRSIAMGVTG